MKPESWTSLPHPVKEQFLWDLQLNVEPNSSKAYEVDQLMQGLANILNIEIANRVWAGMSVDSYKLRLEQAKERLNRQLNQINNALYNLKRFPQ